MTVFHRKKKKETFDRPKYTSSRGFYSYTQQAVAEITFLCYPLLVL